MRELPKNYFEIFDLPLGYTVDARLLADRYRALARIAETPSGESGARCATNDPDHLIARIEDAYRALLDPLSRAEYLFGLYSAGQPGEQTPETLQVRNGALRMEQMELNERLVAATHRSHPATAVAEVLTQLTEQSAALDKDLQSLFANPSPQNLSSAREIARQLQLLDTCRRDAEAWLDELGIRDE